MIENIKVLHDRLHVFFTNQKQEEYPIIWLRDHARDEINWDSRTSQRKIFTASLDSNTEEEVLKSINSLRGNKTIIMISHNLKNLKDCDYVYSLKNGVLKNEKELVKNF